MALLGLPYAGAEAPAAAPEKNVFGPKVRRPPIPHPAPPLLWGRSGKGAPPAGRRFAPPRGKVTVGRGPLCTVKIPISHPKSGKLNSECGRIMSGFRGFLVIFRGVYRVECPQGVRGLLLGKPAAGAAPNCLHPPEPILFPGTNNKLENGSNETIAFCMQKHGAFHHFSEKVKGVSETP